MFSFIFRYRWVGTYDHPDTDRPSSEDDEANYMDFLLAKAKKKKAKKGEYIVWRVVWGLRTLL